MTTTYVVATVTQTPRREELGAQVQHEWGHSMAWFKAGMRVYVMKRPAWTTDAGSLVPARYFVLHYTEACVSLEEAAAKRFLRCQRQHGQLVTDTSGQAAQIAERIEWELNR